MSSQIKISWIELHPEDDGILTQTPQEFLVPVQCTVSQALAQLPIEHSADELLANRRVAVFGQYALADTPLHDGDRIEILDSLRFDPKESRRRRALHKKQVMPKTGKAAPRRSSKRGPVV